MDFEQLDVSGILDMDVLPDDEELLELSRLLDPDQDSSLPFCVPPPHQQPGEQTLQQQQQQQQQQLPHPSEGPRQTDSDCSEHHQLQETQLLPAERCTSELVELDESTAADWNNFLSHLIDDHNEPAAMDMLQQQDLQEQGNTPAVSFDCYLPNAADQAGDINVATCLGDSSPRSAITADNKPNRGQQALSELLEADSAAAVFSITSEYFENTLTRSSSLTSASSKQSEVSMCLDALMTALEDTTAGHADDGQHVAMAGVADPIAAAAAAQQGKQLIVKCANTSAYDVTGKEGQLLADQLCNVLEEAAKSAGAATPNVSAVKGSGGFVFGGSCNALNSKEFKLSDVLAMCATAAAGGPVFGTTAAPVDSFAAMLPPPSSKLTMQQQLLQSMFPVSAPKISCSPAALSAQHIAGCTAVSSPFWTGAATIGQCMAFSSYTPGYTTPFLSEAAEYSAPSSLLSSGSSNLGAQLLQIQAQCAAQSTQHDKPLSAAERLYCRQQERCNKRARSLNKTLSDSIPIFAAQSKQLQLTPKKAKV